jgi:hypothetical protein
MKVTKSNKKNKEYKVKLPNGKVVHFADPDMPEYPGTKRGDSYCARSYGIGKKYGTLKDKNSPNYWSRRLWSCKGKKSVSKKRFFGNN